MTEPTYGDRFVMKDLSAAERRLIAALDRMDHAVERAARRLAELGPAGPDAAAVAVPAGVAGDIAALHDRQAATLAAMRAQLAQAHQRLTETGAQAAQLAAANETLAAANRRLVTAAGGAPEDWARDGGAAMVEALEAELAALRAARAAEIAHMGEILDALDRMLGVPAAAAAAAAAADAADAGPADPAALPLGAEDELPEDSAADAVLPPGIAHDEDPLPEDARDDPEESPAEEPR